MSALATFLGFPALALAAVRLIQAYPARNPLHDFPFSGSPSYSRGFIRPPRPPWVWWGLFMLGAYLMLLGEVLR